MRGIMGMRGTRVGMMEMREITERIRGTEAGMQGIRVGMWGIAMGMRGIGGWNKENHVENLRIGVEMMNKNCGER